MTEIPSLQHNAFRSPGAPSGDDLRAKQPKVTYFKNIYAKMHRGIVDHAVYVDAGNVEELRGMDFVFLCLDKGSAKKVIVEKLEEFNVPFSDVGMGIQLNNGTLGGIVRVTTSTAEEARPFAKQGLFRGRGGWQRVRSQYPDRRPERAECRSGGHQMEEAVRLLPRSRI